MPRVCLPSPTGALGGCNGRACGREHLPRPHSLAAGRQDKPGQDPNRQSTLSLKSILFSQVQNFQFFCSPFVRGECFKIIHGHKNSVERIGKNRARRLKAHHRRSAYENQMSQAQCRAKRGAAPALTVEKLDGQIEEVPAETKIQTTTAGAGDKTCCCEPAGNVAVTGVCGTEVDFAAQQDILPPQPQS